MKNATLRQLRVFESAARHLSLTRAAEELHLTPPAVSIQVRQLEGHAKAALFERLGRGLRLTQAGRAIADIHDFRGEHFEIEDYDPHPPIADIPFLT